MITFAERFLVLILAAASTLEGEFTPNILCDNPLMNDNYRRIFLSFHNRKRLAVAVGREPNKIGMQNSARGMYALSWDCTLEYVAQTAVDCSGLTLRFAKSMNTMKWTYSDPTDDVIPLFYETLEQWWNVGRIHGVSSNNSYYHSIDSFAKMVFSDTTKLGCAYRTCVDGAESYISIACYYNAVPHANQPLWTTGPPCTTNSHCTHPKSICAGGICIEKAEEY